jgi:hypothetical protein
MPGNHKKKERPPLGGRSKPVDEYSISNHAWSQGIQAVQDVCTDCDICRSLMEDSCLLFPELYRQYDLAHNIVELQPSVLMNMSYL